MADIIFSNPEGAGNISEAIIDIDIRDGDGIYLIIDNPKKGPTAERKAVLDLIDGYGIQEVDFMKVSAALKRTELHVEVCISSNTDIKRAPETMEIVVSKDKMTATAKFTPPVNKGGKLTSQDIQKIIEREGIRFGVPVDLPDVLAASHEYNTEYTVATGQKSEDGVDGRLEYHFDAKKKTYKPKETEDGKVDFRNLDLIEKASKDQVLVSVIPAVPGNDGINVLGQVVSARMARLAPPLTAGKNVMQTEDGSQLIATESGQILFEGKKVSVSPELEIAGDVDNSTGNIDFNGSIIIKGNVRAGFIVSAVGNIEIMGVVEGAKVSSGNSVILYAGIQGNGVGEITAGESITAKFVENSILNAGRDIVSDSIMHSKVTCGGALTLKGKNGLLVGGHTRVAGKLEAQTIGSSMATATELEVGMDPQKLQEYRDLQAEAEVVKNEYEQHNRIFVTLNTHMKKGTLPVDKKVLLLKTINLRGAARDKYEAIQDRMRDLLPYLDTTGEVISVHKIMHTGVKLLLGNRVLLVQRPIERSRIKNTGGKIQLLPL